MRKKLSIISLMVYFVVLFSGCGNKSAIDTKQEVYDGRVFYEVFVRAFKDSDGDGIGDINGLTQSLDYLKDLGIRGLWLMPINDSPSYHGYDVNDYYKINPQYGTMDDFKKLLEEAHKRDIKIFTDMVFNHTSIENKWFKEAGQDKNSKYRDYYIWSNDSSKENETSPMGTKPWSKNGDKDEYYYSIFWKGMPDLNLDNKDVREELKKIGKYYIDMGVDGFRLDAAKWMYNDTNKNVDFWKAYNDYCKSLKKDFVLVGEVWDNAFAMAPYQKGLDSFFDFSLGEMIITGIKNGYVDDIPQKIIDNYQLFTEDNKNFVTSPFLSNHDIDRVMSKLNDDEEMKMAATIYLTLPGTPYIYYGEELGMKGRKPDERIREPFIWSDKDDNENTSWITVTNDVDKVALNKQKEDKNSVYNFYKNLLKVRNERKALRVGKMEHIDSKESSTMMFKRVLDKESIIVIINTGRDEVKVPLEKGKYEILLDNKEGKGTIKSNGEASIKGGQILIVNKI